jgi:hypothetical protein
VDVQLGGSYYVVGVYDNNPSLADSNMSYSQAYFFQRIRLMPVIKVAEGLTFTARMDAMEGLWDTSTLAGNRSAQSVDTGRNFDWERGWLSFKTGIGQVDVGYMSGGAWGTTWADNEGVRARIKLTTKVGPMILIPIYEKNTESNDTVIAGGHFSNADNTAYYLGALYPFKGGTAGVLYGYLDIRQGRTLGPTASKTQINLLYPFFKATFGSVYVEAELNYLFGKTEFETPNAVVPALVDVDRNGWGAYMMAKTAMGPATIGAQVGWSKGDDEDTLDKNETGPGGGTDWNPALILMNDELNTWSGGNLNTMGSNKTGGAASDDGLLLLNLFGEYKVTPKFSMGAALTYAKADKVNPATVAQPSWDKDYGTEFDVTASYKLYDNLTYMVGAGYLWTGDYYKLGVPTAKVENDYILMNRLTLTF